jgi:hypothetical protein
MSPGFHGECGPAILPHEQRGPENSLPVPQIRALFLRLPAVRRKDKSAAFCTRATIPRPASSATIVALSVGAFLGPNAITEVDVSSAWTRIIAPFPLNATLADIVDNDAAFYGGKSAHFSENCGEGTAAGRAAVQERARSRVAEIAELWAAGYL